MPMVILRILIVGIDNVFIIVLMNNIIKDVRNLRKIGFVFSHLLVRSSDGVVVLGCIMTWNSFVSAVII